MKRGEIWKKLRYEKIWISDKDILGSALRFEKNSAKDCLSSFDRLRTGNRDFLATEKHKRREENQPRIYFVLRDAYIVCRQGNPPEADKFFGR